MSRDGRLDDPREAGAAGPREARGGRRAAPASGACAAAASSRLASKRSRLRCWTNAARSSPRFSRRSTRCSRAWRSMRWLRAWRSTRCERSRRSIRWLRACRSTAASARGARSAGCEPGARRALGATAARCARARAWRSMRCGRARSTRCSRRSRLLAAPRRSARASLRACGALGANALLAALAGSGLRLGCGRLAVAALLAWPAARSFRGAHAAVCGLRRRGNREGSDGGDQKRLGHENVVRCWKCSQISETAVITT